MGEASLGRRIAIKSALVVGSLLVSALLVEATARVLGLASVPNFRTEGDPLLRPCNDPVLRFENNAGSRSRQVYPLEGGAERVAEFTIDEHGLRGGCLSREKPPGMFRIACLGDSQTFGDGVGDDETWPHHLQQVLDPGRRCVEVLNFGVNAYETEQQVHLLETRVLGFEPDLVLLAYFVNDANVRSRAGSARPLPVPRPSGLHAVLTGKGWFASLRSVSRFLDWSADRIVRREGLEYFGKSRDVLYAEDAPGWQVAREQLSRARDLLERRDIPFVVVLYPFMHRSGEHLATHEAYGIVAAFLEHEGIRSLDLEPAYAGQDMDEMRAHPRNAHSSGAAHLIAAGAIAESLRMGGLVPREDRP